MDTTYDADINGVKLRIRETGDDFPMSVARHEYPDVDGADLDKMGLKACKVRFTAIFADETYENHRALLDLREETDPLEFTHPWYGVLTGEIENIHVRHAPRKTRACEVDVVFIQGRTEDGGYTLYTEIQGASEDAAPTALDEAQDEVAEAMKETLGAEAATILDKTIAAGQAVLEQVEGVTQAARSYVKVVSDTVAGLEATLNTITNPVNSLIATVNWATDLPGRVVGAITETVERYTELYGTVKDAPDRFMTSYTTAIDGLEKELGLDDASLSAENGTATGTAKAAAEQHMQNHLRITAATVGALHLGYMFAADEEDRRALKRLEGVRSFDAAGRYLAPPAAPEILTVTQIERALATSREMLQDAVDRAQNMPSLKAQALNLLDHVERIKLERENIKTIRVDHPTPLHLVCHQNGLPSSAAARVLAINPQIINPNFVQGEIKIYVD
jgi:prophage DNA circulation protein